MKAKQLGTLVVPVLGALILTLGLCSCSSAPVPRQAHLDVDWIRSTTNATHFGFRHAERTSPLVDTDLVFQGNAFDGVVAFDKNSGRQVWRLDIKNGVESGFATSGESLYFGASDGQFYAVNKSSGKIIWTFPTRAENLAQPLVAGDVVYFLAGNNVLYALDATTGKQVWVYNRGDSSSLSIRGGARPTLYKGTLYVGFSDGFLTAINSRDGSLMWERKLNSNLKFVDVDATAVVDENDIWVSSFDGALYCLSRADGQVLWRLEDGGAVPVTIDGDNLYYASINQSVYSLNKKSGTQKWKYSYNEHDGVPTQPVLYRGLVFVGASDGDLMALNQQSGALVTRYQPGTGVFATPALDPSTGRLYVFSNQSNLHVLNVAWRRVGPGPVTQE